MGVNNDTAVFGAVLCVLYETTPRTSTILFNPSVALKRTDQIGCGLGL